MVSLATGVHAQAGVYALLLGSGVSTGAGVPTGWGVVTELARRAGTASGGSAPGEDFEPEKWWASNGDGQPLGYSGLLGALAPTSAARRALLARFFEPSDTDDGEAGKVPGAAHRAIAELVKRGAVRVILTTNFDRLVEQALEAVGIMPQVIATPAAVGGMEPLTHARCTVIKLHGDYSSLDQRNTVDELSTYTPEMDALLERVLDEYGLIVSGWSAEWDHALVGALEGTRSRRYPLYWASYGQLGTAAARLVAQHRATHISGVSADALFPDLVGRLDALDSLTHSPISLSMSVAQIKRALPDARRHIEVADLVNACLGPVRERLATRATYLSGSDPAALEREHDVLVQDSLPLLHLLATGVYWDRDQQHNDLWVRVVGQLMRARRAPTGAFQQWLDALAHLPALLALRTIVTAATEMRHEELVVRALCEPTWRSYFGRQEDTPAALVLHDGRVLNGDIVNMFPRWDGHGWLYPPSHYIKDVLAPVLTPLIGEGDEYTRAFRRAEYRTALAQHTQSEPHSRPAPGEFMLDSEMGDDGMLVSEKEFRSSARREAWGWAPVAEGAHDPLDDHLRALSQALGRRKREE